RTVVTEDFGTGTSLVTGVPFLNVRTVTLYDAAGNVVQVTDPLNHVTTYEYDALNRQTSMTEAAGTTDQRPTPTPDHPPRHATHPTAAGGLLPHSARPAAGAGAAAPGDLGPAPTRVTGVPFLTARPVPQYDAVGTAPKTPAPLSRAPAYAFGGVNRRTREV